MDKIYVYANDVKFGELSFEDGICFTICLCIISANALSLIQNG